MIVIIKEKKVKIEDQKGKGTKVRSRQRIDCEKVMNAKG